MIKLNNSSKITNDNINHNNKNIIFLHFIFEIIFVFNYLMTIAKVPIILVLIPEVMHHCNPTILVLCLPPYKLNIPAHKSNKLLSDKNVI